MQPFDFSQKHYFLELERRHQITSSLSIPIGVLALLIGAITFLASNFNFDFSTLSVIFGVFLLGSISSSIVTVIQLFRSYWSYEYQYLASPIDYKQYYDSLVSYYKENSDRDANSHASKDFEETLSQNYAEAATINWRNNNQKSATLHKANTSLVWLVVFVFLSSTIFYFK